MASPRHSPRSLTCNLPFIAFNGEEPFKIDRVIPPRLKSDPIPHCSKFDSAVFRRRRCNLGYGLAVARNHHLIASFHGTNELG